MIIVVSKYTLSIVCVIVTIMTITIITILSIIVQWWRCGFVHDRRPSHRFNGETADVAGTVRYG